MRNQIKSKVIALFSILTIVLVGAGVSSREVTKVKEIDAAVENWTKITGTSTSAFVGGNKYLLTYGNSYLVPGAYGGKNPSAATFDLSSVQESAAWTFVDKGSGNWHIHDGTNYLKIETNNTSGLRTQTSAPNTYFSIASSGSDTWQLKTTSTGNRCPAYYAAGSDWRSYAASNATTKLTIYKYVPTATVPVTGISLNKTSLSLYTENSEKLIATVIPSNASNPTINWTSNKSSVASVSADGTVTGVTVGDAIITAKTVDGGFTKTCAVTVTQNPLVIDKFSAKGFGGYAGGFDLNDHTGTVGVANTTLALRVFNGGTGAIRGNQSGIENNFSMRNIDRLPGYIRKIIIIGTGGTSFTASATRSLVNVGDTPYSLDNATTGTKVQGVYTTNGGSHILTWEIPSNVDARYFIMHNLQAGGTMLAVADDAIQIFYEPVEDTFGTLDHIVVNSSSSSLKKTYHVGEALTTIGLLVTAYDTEGRDLITSEYTTNPVVGYRFKQGDLGSKSISVTITIDGVSKSGSYTVSVIAAATYNKVNTIVDVICGQVYVMASPLGGAASLDFTTFASAVEIDYNDSSDSFTEVTNLQKLTLEIGSAEDSYAIKLLNGENADKYYAWSSGNTLKLLDEINDESSWYMTFGGDEGFRMINVGDDARFIAHNHTSTRFAAYTAVPSGESTAFLYIDQPVGYGEARGLADWIMSHPGGNITTPECATKYAGAKTKWTALSLGAKEAFKDHTDFLDARNRLQKWAIANGETIDYFYSGVSGVQEHILNSRNNLGAIVVISILGLTTIIGYYFLKRKEKVIIE